MSQGVDSAASGEVRRRSKATASTNRSREAHNKDSGGTAAAVSSGPRTSQPPARSGGSTWRTFGLFAVAIPGAPLAAFYGAKDTLLGGNVAHAGALAVVVVNVVLIGYIVVCLLEHDGEDVPPVDPVVPTEKEESKDK